MCVVGAYGCQVADRAREMERARGSAGCRKEGESGRRRTCVRVTRMDAKSSMFIRTDAHLWSWVGLLVGIGWGWPSPSALLRGS
eukprot:10394069-Alexandrium_andersonii.AAC.1